MVSLDALADDVAVDDAAGMLRTSAFDESLMAPVMVPAVLVDRHRARRIRYVDRRATGAGNDAAVDDGAAGPKVTAWLTRMPVAPVIVPELLILPEKVEDLPRRSGDR